MLCPKCSYQWKPRTASPKRCPRCGKWLIPKPGRFRSSKISDFFPVTEYVRGMPRVRTSDGYLVPWNDEAIVSQLLRETRLSSEMFGIPPISREDAIEISREARERIRDMHPMFVSGPFVREIVNNILIEWSKGHPEYQIYRNLLTRVGTPVFDAYEIDIGRGWEAKENANLQPNPETAHKKKADRLSKEEYLLLMDPHLSTAHVRGDIHIHDLEYFGTRPFCLDGAEILLARINGRPVFIEPRMLDPYFRNSRKIGEYEVIEPSHIHLELLTLNGFRMVKRIHRRRSPSKMLKVVTEDGSATTVTPEHNLMLWNGDRLVERRATDLRPGDGIAYVRPLVPHGNKEEIDFVQDLIAYAPCRLIKNVYVRGLSRATLERFGRKGISLHTSWRKRGIVPLRVFYEGARKVGLSRDDYRHLKLAPVGSRRELPCILKITPAIARFVGLFVADGNYDVELGDVYNVIITGKGPCTEDFVREFTTDLGLHVTLGKSKGKTPQYYVASKMLYLLLRFVLGIKPHASNKQLPRQFLQFTDDIKRDMLGALFYGDGSAFYDRRRRDAILTYQTTSESLIKQLSLYLKSIDVPFTINTLVPKSSVGKRALYRIAVSSHGIRRLVECINLIGQQASEINDFLVEVRESKRASVAESRCLVLADGGLDLQTVRSVEESLPSHGHVYDFVLDGSMWRDHVFLTGSGIYVHNCQDWDLRYFLYYGLLPDGMGFKSSVAGPAKHPEVAVLHSVKVLAAAQTNFSGGQGFMYYTVFLAPFMRGLPYDQVKQLAQMMFYELTQTYVTRGGQLVFSNIQLPMGVPKIWKDKPIVVRGQVGPDVYGDYEDEVRALFKAINEVALEGDYWGKPFNFPKMEEYVSPEFFTPEYEDLWLLVHKVIGKYGIPYLDNMFPAYRGYGKGVSCYQCCAYNFVSTSEVDENFDDKMYFENGAHFSLGGWQVVSMNMPRLSYKAKGDYDKLREEAYRCMDLAVKAFETKHKWMNTMIDNKRIPFAVQRPRDPRTGGRAPPSVDFDELVYVVGIIGVNEMVQHLTGHQLHESEDAVKMALKLLIDMEKYRRELVEGTEMKIYLARTPAESSAQRLATADLCSPEFARTAKKLVKGDLKRGESMLSRGVRRDIPVYYTNGTHTYVGARLPLARKIDIEHKFFPILSGGNIFHVWLGEAFPDAEGLFHLTKRIVKNSQIGYFAYTKDMTVCATCNKVSFGLLESCPHCDSANVKWWSRVTGYYQDVTGWNEGKKAELMERHRIAV